MATDASEKKAAAKSAPAAEQLPCPRCSSSNTKFCYYNNYNFSQPRHFCKACRRYWTHGGTLRDIPVGGATRKNAKRSRTSTNTILPAAAAFSSAYHRDFRHLPAAASHLLAAGHGGPIGGSFTTLLNSSPATGLLAFGVGIDDVGGGFGLGRPAWPFAAVVDGGAAAHTWQMESGESGFVGGGDCFGFPDLAISTPAGTFSK